MSTPATTHGLHELVIFKNGLSAELLSLTPLKNELKQKQSEVKTKELAIIGSIVSKLTARIADEETRKVFLLQTSEKHPSLLHELVSGCVSFDSNASREVKFCKKPLCFFTVDTAEKSSMQLVEKMNEAAKAFASIAVFTAQAQVGQICFSFSLV